VIDEGGVRRLIDRAGMHWLHGNSLGALRSTGFRQLAAAIEAHDVERVLAVSMPITAIATLNF
jgi:hypothetical protein